MNSKNIFLALALILIALFLIGNVSATDNVTVNDYLESDDIVTNLEFEQNYNPSTVTKGDVFDVYLNVKNVGPNTYHNLTISYPLPEGLDVLIFPVEYKDNSIWIIDVLYPDTSNRLTLVCSPLISNTTYEFTVGVGNQSVSTMNVYCQPDPVIPDDNGTDTSNTTDNSYTGLIKSIAEGKTLKNTANPILLLLFTIIFIPFIRLKY